MYSALKAIHWPSAEIFGKSSSPAWDVSRCAGPPATGARQMSPAYTKTTKSRWMSGKRSSRASGAAAESWAAAGAARASTKTATVA